MKESFELSEEWLKHLAVPAAQGTWSEPNIRTEAFIHLFQTLQVHFKKLFSLHTCTHKYSQLHVPTHQLWFSNIFLRGWSYCCCAEPEVFLGRNLYMMYRVPTFSTNFSEHDHHDHPLLPCFITSPALFGKKSSSLVQEIENFFQLIR